MARNLYLITVSRGTSMQFLAADREDHQDKWAMTALTREAVQFTSLDVGKYVGYMVRRNPQATVSVVPVSAYMIGGKL